MRTLLWILFLLTPAILFGQNNDLQNMANLASKYYQNKEFGKAAELYEQLYTITKSEGYFNIYFDCLLGIPDYDKAEKAIKKRTPRQFCRFLLVRSVGIPEKSSGADNRIGQNV